MILSSSAKKEISSILNEHYGSLEVNERISSIEAGNNNLSVDYKEEYVELLADGWHPEDGPNYDDKVKKLVKWFEIRNTKTDETEKFYTFDGEYEKGIQSVRQIERRL